MILAAGYQMISNLKHRLFRFQGMGEAAAATGDGGPPTGDGGAGDACALCRGGRATGPAAQHTAAGRRVWPGRTSTAASPLSGE